MGTLNEGTEYVEFDRIPINVLTTPFHNVRVLQLADLVTSCTTALVAGSIEYATPVFEHIKPLFLSDSGRIGGIGVKIHPDFRYTNLYHWLLDDYAYVQGRYGAGCVLPMTERPYAEDPMTEQKSREQLAGFL